MKSRAGAAQGHRKGPAQVTKATEKKRKREDATDELKKANVTSNKWFPSAASDVEIQRLKVEGSFPLDLRYQIPPKGEVPSAPVTDECVVHQDFFDRGLGFPLHPFVRGLLLFFGSQLHHLSPIEILHIANFITICECYLGTPPHFELFRHLFCIRVQMNGKDFRDLAGVSLQLRPLSNFFLVAFPKSLWAWHKNWPYDSGLGSSLPAFFGRASRPLRSWESLNVLSEDAQLLVNVAACLKDEGLEGIHILRT